MKIKSWTKTTSGQSLWSWDDVISVDTTSPAFQKTGSAMITLGTNLNGEGLGVQSNLVSPFGLYSLPLPGTIGQENGCKVLSLTDNSEYFSIAGRDYAFQTQVGGIKPGETALYASGSQARVLLKLDGSINLYSQASKGATSMGTFISPSTDSIQMINAAGNGVSISNGSGGNVNGTTLFAASSGSATASFQVLANGNISSTASQVHQIDGASIIIGSQAAAVVNVATINPTALVQALTLITTAISTLVSSTGPCTSPDLPVALTYIASLLPLISSQKTMIQ